jgi:hypothetical protein
MTYGARVIPLPISESQLKARWIAETEATAEQRWRLACYAFLYAAFQRLAPATLRRRADEMDEAREAFVDQSRHGVPTGDRRPSPGTSKDQRCLTVTDAKHPHAKP